MNKKEKSEWLSWWRFFSRRVREFIFLGVWAALAWSLDRYIVHPLPISGSPKYMLFVFEGLFDIVTLVELTILLFWPYKKQTSRWWRKKRNTGQPPKCL